MTLIICNGMNRSGSTLPQYNPRPLAQTGRGQAQGFILPEQLAEAAPASPPGRCRRLPPGEDARPASPGRRLAGRRAVVGLLHLSAIRQVAAFLPARLADAGRQAAGRAGPGRGQL